MKTNLDNCLNDYTTEQLMIDQTSSQSVHPVRYIAKLHRIPFLASCWWWLIKRKWIRYENTFEPIFYGDLRYDDAPYEAAWLSRVNGV